MPDITMPKLSDSMEEGTILQWRIEDGQTVQVGDELVEIETDKATTVYEAEVEGALRTVASVGDTVAVGGLIATIGAPVEREPVASAGLESAQADSAAQAPGRNDARPANGRLIATPIARRIARESGLALEGVIGTGPRGRIRMADVKAAAHSRVPVSPPSQAEPPPPPVPTVARGDAVPTAKGTIEAIELSAIQRTIVRRMSESRATVPDFSIDMDVDCSALVRLREDLRRIADPLPSINDFVVKASAVALRRHPKVNASYRDGRFELYDRVNVGIAVATDNGLIVPTVFDADQKSLSAIAARTRTLAAAVRDGTIAPGDLSGGTFTISNLGMYGVAGFTAVINVPQAAILAVGASTDTVVLREGEVTSVPVVRLTLCCDHRILDGAAGAEFLQTLKGLLEEPLLMAL